MFTFVTQSNGLKLTIETESQIVMGDQTVSKLIQSGTGMNITTPLDRILVTPQVTNVWRLQIKTQDSRNWRLDLAFPDLSNPPYITYNIVGQWREAEILPFVTDIRMAVEKLIKQYNVLDLKYTWS